EHLWRVLRAEDAPESVFLAGWPSPADVDTSLLEEVAAVRRVVELGRQARSMSGLKHRQPLRRLVVQGAERAATHVDEIRDEGRVFDLIHLVNTKRKDAGLELTDRITLTLPESERDLLAHEQWIKDEVLAVEIRTDGVAEPEIAKA